MEIIIAMTKMMGSWKKSWTGRKRPSFTNVLRSRIWSWLSGGGIECMVVISVSRCTS